jgi:HAD superfamily hydrolase (TIGR01509 family)
VAKRPDLVIFDCDGVLVDTERVAIRLEVQLLAELGWEITEAEIVERFVGVSDGAMERMIEEYLGRPLPLGWTESVQPRYREAFEAELTPVDGVIAALDAIDEAGIPTCVASSGTHDKMRFTLGRTGLFERFAGRIFSATQVARGKPEPDLFQLAADTMGVPYDRCAVVEDSRPGVEAALAAGMRGLAYAGGVTPKERLELAGAELFEDMAELPGLLGLRDLPAGVDVRT